MYWPRLGTVLLIATHLWGTPACGTPRIVYADPPTSPNEVGWTFPLAPDPSLDCIIFLNRRLVRDPEVRCTAIVHEWGHLTGHSHSVDPMNPMYANDRDSDVYWRCSILSEPAVRKWLKRSVPPQPQYPLFHAYMPDAPEEPNPLDGVGF